MFFLIICFSIFSEYRVYLLDLEKSNNENVVIKSTLDQVQFKTYYPGFKKVELLDTWMCFGDTASKKLCEKKEKLKVAK